METVPADVLIARAVRAHTRAIATLAISCLVLALVGVAALSLAGADRGTPPITAGLSLLAIGQLAALAALAIAVVGLVRLLRNVGEPAGKESGASEPAPAADPVRAEVPQATVRSTAARLAILMRVLLGACVLTITVWALANSAGVVGAVVGALVALQLLVVLSLLRVHMLRSV